VQLFTEYAFAESLLPADSSRFADPPVERDTPDVVVSGPDWLLAIEAKMFHRPTAGALHAQMSRQAPLVRYWAHALGLDEHRVRHVLLLPAALVDDRPELSWPVVTWEQVHDAYWLGVLRFALDRYHDMASVEPTFGVNADAILRGEQIATISHLKYEWVGRIGGLHGAAFAADRIDDVWGVTGTRSGTTHLRRATGTGSRWPISGPPPCRTERLASRGRFRPRPAAPHTR